MPWTRLWVHSLEVAETHWTNGRRAVIEDTRREGAWLRTTWHPEAGVFVISPREDDVCVAATRAVVGVGLRSHRSSRRWPD